MISPLTRQSNVDTVNVLSTQIHSLPTFTEIGNSLACSSITSDAIDKQRPQQDSAHQIGVETPLTDFLMVV